MRVCLVAFLIAFLASSCTLATAVKGEYYLHTEKYNQGVVSLRNQLRENPNDSTACYFLGRYLLALNRPKEARTYLERAVKIDPDKADYHFWLGQAYYALGQTNLEEESYRRALSIDSKNVPANLYLGNILLQKGEPNKALSYYEQVLELQPKNAEALYNTGLALTELRRGPEAATAWERYLANYPQGKWAIHAADHLNAQGNFTYRNFVIGYLRFPVKRIQFAPFSSQLQSDSTPDLKKIGWVLRSSNKFKLEIVAHQKNDARLAAYRARKIRDRILQLYPIVKPTRLIAKGTGRPEVVREGSRRYRLNQSVTFVTEWH